MPEEAPRECEWKDLSKGNLLPAPRPHTVTCQNHSVAWGSAKCSRCARKTAGAVSLCRHATHFYFSLSPLYRTFQFPWGIHGLTGEVVATRSQGTWYDWISWVCYPKALSFQSLCTIRFLRMWCQGANFAGDTWKPLRSPILLWSF